MLSLCLLTTVSKLSQNSQNVVTRMLADLEKDKAAGRYVIWLRFTPVLGRNDCRKENVVEFLDGELHHIHIIRQLTKYHLLSSS